MRGIVARLQRRVRRRSPRGIVLCYHRVAGPRRDPAMLDVSADQFTAHLAVLRTQARAMPLAAFERARRGGTLPERAVAVTFDDGYADNLHVALPLLTTHDVPATVFVTTSGIDAEMEYWWDALERACFEPPALPSRLNVMVRDRVFSWPSGDGAARTDAGIDRDALYRALSAWLRTQPAAVQGQAMAQLAAWAGVSLCARTSHRPLRVDELQALAHSPLIEIGSHSVTHPMLDLRGPAERADECVASRTALARWLGSAPAHFAYPFGEGGGIGRGTESAARAAGYEAAFTTDARAAWRGNRAMAVPRISMQAWDGAEFARRLTLWFDE
jgi:peptidoglycan/xylan/chitin deacetylase (PgdA/CDA1 family)